MSTSALTWENVDGVAVVTFDLPGESVNKITQAVKDEFIATFETLAHLGANHRRVGALHVGCAISRSHGSVCS
jgi:enoyl-CoA hydratase/carnithine racemase